MMRVKTNHVLVILAWMTVCGLGTEFRTRPWPGLSIQSGVLTLKGRPYSGIGANYFSLFSRTIRDSSDMSYERGLDTLSREGIPFVRFMAGGFWPIDWDLYRQDKNAYFQRLDAVIKCAEANEIGLIPSLFWNMSTVPDIVGESMDQYGNTSSKTIAFVRQYTAEVVQRYRHSSAIWAWEFGNEYNLAVDLPNASEHRPPIWPNLKTALKRTEQDELSSQAMLVAYTEFAETIRKYDTHRILITGNSIPRPSAYHNSKEKTWTKDSSEQFSEILLRDNPDPFQVISVHVYPRTDQTYSAHAKTVTDLVATVQATSLAAGKSLFIGEFGAPTTLGGDQERSEFSVLLNAIEMHKVPLSAFWVFDHPGQSKDWNVTFDNPRQYMLKLVSEANQRIKGKHKY